MLSASPCVCPNDTVTRLSTSCTTNAPPVAEFATKSAVSATGRGLSAAFWRHASVAALVYVGVPLDPHADRETTRTAASPTRRPFTARPVYGAPRPADRSTRVAIVLRRVRRRGPSPQVRAAR